MTGGLREVERVAELHRYADPADAHSEELDDIVAEAATVAGVVMAAVNLMDTDLQCPAATTGFAGEPTPRREAMCDVAVELGRFVHVPDARTDPRFADSPWVDGRLGEVRFYASAPLITPRGYVLGTLCVFDVVPHELSEPQIGNLERLAARVVESFQRDRRGE